MSKADEVISILNERGWHQGDYQNEDGSVCILGAINLLNCADADVWWIKGEGRLMNIIDGIIKEQFPDRTNEYAPPIPIFNDHPETTLDDVFLVLEKARIKEEELND